MLIALNGRKRKQKEIQALNAVLEMQESERKRIAEDLHDELSPMLSAVKLKINSIRQMQSTDEIEQIVKETTTYVDSIIQDVRLVVRNLSPTNLSKYGLVQSIEDFKNTVEKNNRIKFDFMHEGLEKRFKESAEINIYRILSEMINNSVKHSNCDAIKLLIKVYKDKTSILYTDNGQKIQTEEKSHAGMGLRNITSRVNLFKGELHKKKDFSTGAFYQILFDNHILLANE